MEALTLEALTLEARMEALMPGAPIQVSHRPGLTCPAAQTRRLEMAAA